MKKIMMVLGVVALLAAAGVSIGVANAKPGGQELTVDLVLVANTATVPGSSFMEIGERFTAIFELYNEGEAGVPEELIGKAVHDFVKIEPLGTPGG